VSPRTSRRPTADPLGAAIRARRLALELRQRDVADRAGVNIRTVWLIERGQGHPASKSLRQVADVLGLTLTLIDRSVADRIAELESRLGQAQTALSWESLRETKRRADRDQAELTRARARIAALEADAASLKAAQCRYEEALNALARQPVLTHDLIDQARAACNPRGRNRTRTPERTAA
jgi:transcriptional regulator with XRE-family HTH domain